MSNTGADGEQGWAGETFWGPSAKSRNDYVCGPDGLLDIIPPIRVDIQGAHALKPASCSGIWDHAPLAALFPLLQLFRPGVSQ